MANPFSPGMSLDIGALLDPVIAGMKERRASSLLQEYANTALGGAPLGQPSRAQTLMRLDPAKTAESSGPNLSGDMAAYAKAIQAKESGGNYQAVGPTHPKLGRALGAYQVMEANVGPWTEQVLGRRLSPQEFLASKEAQDAVFAGKFGESIKKYGNPQDAASVWFTGRPASEGAGKRDVLGTTGANYVASFNANLGRAAPATAAQPVRVASADGADLPAPGASEAQFRIPGGGGAVPAGGGAAVSPQQRDVLMRMLANPATRAAALAQIQELSKSGYDFQVVGDRLVRMDKRRGTAEVVPGIEKPTAWQTFKTEDGRQIAWNPQSLETAVLDKGGGGWRPMTPEEKATYGVPENTGAAVGPDGKPLVLPGTPKTQVSVETKGEGKFAEVMGSERAKQFATMMQEGEQAASALSDIGQLRELSRNLGNQGQAAAVKSSLGPYAEALGINIEGLDNIQAYESIISRLAPTMRPPGSGATSDFEMRQYLNALPGLIRNPQAREMVLDTMQATAEYNARRGEIAASVAAGEMTRSEAEKALRALPKPLEIYRAFRKSNPTIVRDALQTKPEGEGPSPRSAAGIPKVGEVRKGYRYKGGSPADPGSWERVQ